MEAGEKSTFRGIPISTIEAQLFTAEASFSNAWNWAAFVDFSSAIFFSRRSAWSYVQGSLFFLAQADEQSSQGRFQALSPVLAGAAAIPQAFPVLDQK